MQQSELDIPIYRLRPSNKSWLLCPGSIQASEGIPDETTDAAELGTALHELAELCLKQGVSPDSYIGYKMNQEWDITQERSDIAAYYVDWVNNEPGTKQYELPVTMENYAPGCRGTADAVIEHTDTLTVADLKSGMGRVNATDNTQLMLYGLGALNDIADHSFIDTIRLVIVQPRLDHIDQWYIKKDELIKWGHEVVRPAAAKTMAADPEFNPSPEACQWCKARTVCKALAQQQLEIAQNSFEDLDAPIVVTTPHSMSIDEIGKLLPKLDPLIAWAQAIKKRARSLAIDGSIVPGHKLVSGRANRRWKDETVAAETLTNIFGDEAFTRKLISPSQLEKLDKEKALELLELWEKPVGALSLVPEDDPRPAQNTDLNFDEIGAD